MPPGQHPRAVTPPWSAGGVALLGAGDLVMVLVRVFPMNGDNEQLLMSLSATNRFLSKMYVQVSCRLLRWAVRLLEL